MTARTAGGRRRAAAAEADWQAETQEEEARPGERFREQAMTGTYEGLRSRGAAATVGRAAEAPGLREEIGMVRLALARLLEEETDAAAFAAGVARLVSVAVQAAKAEQARGEGRGPGHGPGQDLAAVTERVLREGER